MKTKKNVSLKQAEKELEFHVQPVSSDHRIGSLYGKINLVFSLFEIENELCFVKVNLFFSLFVNPFFKSETRKRTNSRESQSLSNKTEKQIHRFIGFIE